MKYQQIKIDKLIPYARNARTHPESQVAQIAASIREFGFVNPIIIDKDFGIIAGHGRLAAAQKLGLEEVPCLRVEHLTETQKRAYILADNRLAELAEWDNELLKLEFEELKLESFDIELAGFDDEFIEKRFGAEDEKPEGVDHNIADEFLLIVELENENEQQALFESLQQQGYKVKIA